MELASLHAPLVEDSLNCVESNLLRLTFPLVAGKPVAGREDTVVQGLKWWRTTQQKVKDSTGGQWRNGG